MKTWTVGSLRQEPVFPPDRRSVRFLRSNVEHSGVRVLPAVTFIHHDHTYSLTPRRGRTLLDTALDAGIGLDHRCKKGSCGRCKVRICQGIDFLAPPTGREIRALEDRLQLGDRLACQAVFTKDV